MPATRTASACRRRVTSARRSSSARQAVSASSSSGRDRASWACSAVTSDSRRCACATAARASSSSPPRRRCSSTARSVSAWPDSQAEACRSAARSAAARASRARASTMRDSVRSRPRQLGRGGGLLGPSPRLLDRGRGDHAAARAHPPAGGGEAVALGGDHDQVVAREREVDRLLPAVDPDGPADERVEHRLGDRPAVARPDVAADRLGTASRRQRRRRGDRPRRARLPRRQHRAGDAPLAQRGQRGLGRPAAVHHDGGHPGARRRLEGGVPAVVDLDQVDERSHDPVDVAQQLAPARTLQVRQRALERLGPRRRTVLGVVGLVGRHLRRLRRRRADSSSAVRSRSARPRAPRWPPRARSFAWVSRSARTAAPAARCSSAPTLDPSASMSCCSRRAGAGHQLRRGPRRGRCAWSGASPPRTADHRSRRAAPSPSSAASAAVELGPLVRPAGLLLRLGAGQLGGQARRLGLEGRDHVDVGGRVERGDDRRAPLAQQAREPRARSTRPCTRPSASARSSSRRDDSSAVVEVASASRLRRGPRAAHAPRPGRRSGSARRPAGAPSGRPARPRPGSGAPRAARRPPCRASGRRRPGARAGGSGGAPRARGRRGARGSRPWRPAVARPARGGAGA